MPTPDNKLRMLLITRNFPPLTGGMERLMQQMATGAAEYADLTIIGPRGCSRFSPAGARVLETSAKLAPFLLFSLWHGVRACRATRFDLILGGSGLIAPTLYLLRKLFGGKTVVFLHGLDLVVNSTAYQRLFVPCIRRVDLAIANSSATRQIAIDKGVPASRISIVNPGTTLPDPNRIEPRAAFLARMAIPYHRIIVFVGRMTVRKGLSGFIEHSLPAILAAEPDAALIVVGENPDQALTGHGEAREVMALVARLNLRKRVIFLGQLSDDDLTACYAAADVQVFPLIDVPGDIEGFGMVAIEAAACGTPTVAFNLGGVSDAVDKPNGLLVRTNDYFAFSEAVLQIIRTGCPTGDSCIEQAQRFTWREYNTQIQRLIARETNQIKKSSL